MADFRRFGLDSSGSELCERAARLADDHGPITVCTVLRAELMNASSVATNLEHTCPEIAAILRDSAKVARLIDVLSAVEALTPVLSTGELSEDLERCLKLADQWQPTSDLAIVAAILTDDNAASRALRHVGADNHVNVPELLNALTSKALKRADGRDQRSHGAPDDLPMPELVIPTSDLRYADIHRSTLTDVCKDLETCSQQQFVLVSGRNGTELYHLPQMLADSLKAVRDGSLLNPSMASLASYRAVYKQDVTKLLLWANDPRRVLAHAFNYVVDRRGILVLTHVEAVSKDENAEFKESQLAIIRQLTEPQGAHVVGLFERKEGQHLEILKSLGVSEETVPNECRLEYSPRYALNTLRDYFVTARWAKWGYAFDPDPAQTSAETDGGVFRDLYLLEPGSYRGDHQITWPYLMVEVTESLTSRIRTFKDENSGALDEERLSERIRTHAQSAVEALGKLAPGASEVTKYYQPILDQVRAELQDLLVGPRVRIDEREGKAYVVITRAHLMAELLGAGHFKFQYPSTVPTKPEFPDPKVRHDPPPDTKAAPKTSTPMEIFGGRGGKNANSRKSS